MVNGGDGDQGQFRTSSLPGNYLCVVYMIGHVELDIHRHFIIDENSQKNN